jgi:hypothetical protein
MNGLEHFSEKNLMTYGRLQYLELYHTFIHADHDLISFVMTGRLGG